MAISKAGGGRFRTSSPCTSVIPVFQGSDLCGIDGNTDSLTSPLWLHAKFRNFVVVNRHYLGVGGGRFSTPS